MCVIRSPAMANANTVTVTPSCYRMNVIIRQPAGDYQPGQFG
jgi:hypothetical protein